MADPTAPSPTTFKEILEYGSNICNIITAFATIAIGYLSVKFVINQTKIMDTQTTILSAQTDVMGKQNEIIKQQIISDNATATRANDLALLEILREHQTQYEKVADWFYDAFGGWVRTGKWNVGKYSIFLIAYKMRLDGEQGWMNSNAPNKYRDKYIDAYQMWDTLGTTIFSENFDFMTPTELLVRFPAVIYVPYLLAVLREQKRFKVGVWVLAIIFAKSNQAERLPSWVIEEPYIEHLKKEVQANCLLEFEYNALYKADVSATA